MSVGGLPDSDRCDRKRTAPMPGTRRPLSSSMSAPATTTGLGYTYADASRRPADRNLGPTDRSRRTAIRLTFPPAGSRCSAPCETSAAPASPPARSRRSIARSGTSRPSFSAFRSRRSSAAAETPFRSTAAAASRTTPTTGSRSNLSAWVERDGCRFVKMKIGSDPEKDPGADSRGQARDRRP